MSKPIEWNLNNRDDDEPESSEDEFEEYEEEDDTSVESSSSDDDEHSLVMSLRARSEKTDNGFRGRNWVFTINNYTRDEVDKVKKLFTNTMVKYGICGAETGKRGTPHLQGYIVFKNPQQRKVFGREYLPRAWVEKALGNPAQNKAYCSKEGNVLIEFGSLPVGRGARTDIRSVKDVLDETHSLAAAYESHFDTTCRYSRAFREYLNLRRCNKYPCEITTVDTHEALDREIASCWIEDPINQIYWYADHMKGWFDGYDGHDVIIISNPKEYLEIKRLIYQAISTNGLLPVKNGFAKLKARKVIITRMAYDLTECQYDGNTGFHQSDSDEKSEGGSEVDSK